MQSQDEYNRIKQLTEVDFSKLDDLAAKVKAAEEKGAVSHVIGKLPKAGDNVQVNGLSYRVDFADFVKGKFVVKLTCRDK
jgi:Mg2+/Co2+ transporter CorC